MEDFKFTAEFIIKQLEKMHDPKEFAFFDELRVGTGWGKDSEQRFDGYAIHYMKGKRNVTRSFEVKISRSDFFHEIKKPLKRRHALRLSHEYYFVTPTDLVKIEEVPPECGLMFVNEFGEINVVIKAPYRESMPTWQFLAAISRRLDAGRRKEWEVEQKIKELVVEREVLTRLSLERHLKKWREHNIGSREIPDRILDALEELKREIDYAITENRK